MTADLSSFIFPETISWSLTFADLKEGKESNCYECLNARALTREHPLPFGFQWIVGSYSTGVAQALPFSNSRIFIKDDELNEIASYCNSRFTQDFISWYDGFLSPCDLSGVADSKYLKEACTMNLISANIPQAQAYLSRIQEAQEALSLAGWSGNDLQAN